MEITYLGSILVDELQTHSENNPPLSRLTSFIGPIDVGFSHGGQMKARIRSIT